MNRDEIQAWLQERDEARLETLWRIADEARQHWVGDAIHLRGLIEISNHCIRSCAYCGISVCAPGVERYRMTQAEILACAKLAHDYGFGTIVLQAGEDPGLKQDWVTDIIQAIKSQTGAAVTLSLGERKDQELRAWRKAGADRYLLRFESSDPILYRAIHPSLPGTVSDRLAQLAHMRDLGFEIGTGVMVGIPGQTWQTLTQDICTFQDLDVDMIGIGPYLPSPGTPLAGELGSRLQAAAGAQQVPNDLQSTLKVLALARLVCPAANIPGTTAIATLAPESGRSSSLQRGANIIMPNITPPQYRVLYQIYPGKAGIHETADITLACIHEQIRALGRSPGTGPGACSRMGARK